MLACEQCIIPLKSNSRAWGNDLERGSQYTLSFYCQTNLLLQMSISTNSLAECASPTILQLTMYSLPCIVSETGRHSAKSAHLACSARFRVFRGKVYRRDSTPSSRQEETTGEHHQVSCRCIPHPCPIIELRAGESRKRKFRNVYHSRFLPRKRRCVLLCRQSCWSG